MNIKRSILSENYNFLTRLIDKKILIPWVLTRPFNFALNLFIFQLHTCLPIIVPPSKRVSYIITTKLLPHTSVRGSAVELEDMKPNSEAPSRGILQQMVFLEILQKTTVSETLLKKRLWHRYFPVNFAKFLRTPF